MVIDGYSGVEFNNRPGFQKMLAEIEAGNVGTDITKDLSGLGRNSSLTGLYINYTFPQNNVRYIAINDHFDTTNPNSTDSDIVGIMNWFNEFFAKDTSRKIRAVQKAKGERGERLTVNVPYVYRKDPEDKTNRSSTIPPPTILKSGRTFSSAPRTEPTRTSVAVITSEPLCLNNRSGSIFKKLYRW